MVLIYYVWVTELVIITSTTPSHEPCICITSFSIRQQLSSGDSRELSFWRSTARNYCLARNATGTFTTWYKYCKLLTVIATDVFGSVRSLAAFRLTGGIKWDQTQADRDSGSSFVKRTRKHLENLKQDG
ncbi:hypothetical protein BDZ97DRAFT_1428055 [Flammula alnicola]|nr:hypothetical protein BDZ97DRAFT_1428055 [Flammula alnicola]